jgi:hypothetical protein
MHLIKENYSGRFDEYYIFLCLKFCMYSRSHIPLHRQRWGINMDGVCIIIGEIMYNFDKYGLEAKVTLSHYKSRLSNIREFSLESTGKMFAHTIANNLII